MLSTKLLPVVPTLLVSTCCLPLSHVGLPTPGPSTYGAVPASGRIGVTLADEYACGANVTRIDTVKLRRQAS
jgi:hypothetical protein